MRNAQNQLFYRHALLRACVALLRGEQRSGQSLAALDADDNLVPTLSEVSFSLPDFNQTEFEILDADEMYRLGIAPCPSRTLNLLTCQKLARVFDLSGQREFTKIGDSYLLDIDERLARRGFILPVRTREGFWYALKVYRHPRDPHPFTLKSRREEYIYA